MPKPQNTTFVSIYRLLPLATLSDYLAKHDLFSFVEIKGPLGWMDNTLRLPLVECKT